MSPESRERSHERAATLVQAGMHEDAIALYRRLQAEDWKDLRALAALRDLFRKLERRSELAEQLCLLARHRQEAGRYVQAVQALEAAVEVDRQRPQLHVLLAEALLRTAEVEHARLAFFEAAYRASHAGQQDEARRILLCSLESCGDPYIALKRLLGPQPANRTLSAGIEQQYLYRCLGWPSDGVYVRVAEAGIALAEGRVEAAMLRYLNSLKLGGRPEHFPPEVHLRIAESMRPTDPKLADKYQGYAETARKVPHTVH